MYTDYIHTCHDPLDGSLEVLQLDIRGEVSGSNECCLVADIGHVSPSEARGPGSHLPCQLLSVLLRLDGLQVNLEYGGPGEKEDFLNTCVVEVNTAICSQ